ncbi:hypothetical protein Aergia_0093 [Pseudomonas phage Aergia]|nr:hypothetical protein Aergia_0093 [Pseudomonas phage Aergia]
MTFYFFGRGSEARPLEPKRRTPRACLGNPLPHAPRVSPAGERDPPLANVQAHAILAARMSLGVRPGTDRRVMRD